MRITLVIPARAAAERLDVALAALLPSRSRRELRNAIARGDVEVSGKVVRIASRKLGAGDRVTLSGEEQLSYPELPLIREWDDFAIFDKPPGMLSEPAAPTSIAEAPSTTLEIARRFFALRGQERAFAACVGRLDRPVSGIISIAKSGEAHGKLVAAVRQPGARKIYLAITDGVAPEGQRDIDLPIGRTGPSQFGIASAGSAGVDVKSAQSRVIALARSDDAGLVAIRLMTGRTHQARLHLAAIGAPIAGDSRYGREGSAGSAPPARVFLHAHRLEFRWRNSELRIESPPPLDFLEALRARRLEIDFGAAAAAIDSL